MKTLYPLKQGILCLSLTCILIDLRAQTTSWVNGEAASYVTGQSAFGSSGSATTPAGLKTPYGVVEDPSTGKLFVSDYGNNRVLRYPSTAAFNNGTAAEAVLGQTSLTAGGTGNTSTTMNGPIGLSIGGGTLWVVDDGNNRVLRFDNAATIGNGAAANQVLGQTGFTTKTTGTTASTMDEPATVYYDGTNLWVAEWNNNRVLRFNSVTSKGNGGSADAVLGQAGFTTTTAAATAVGLNHPGGIFVDASNNLWVADAQNNRVLMYKNATTIGNGGSASLVLGQTSFTANGTGLTAAKMNYPSGVTGDGSGALYVTEGVNNRTLIFTGAASLANGSSANFVLGQSTFTTNGSGAASTQERGPALLNVTSDGNNLFVVDNTNNRILVYNPQNILPLESTGFAAQLQANGQVALEWQALLPGEGGRFELQYGTTPTAFDIILDSESADPSKTDYQFYQLHPSQGSNYYRLKTVDASGSVSYSRILRIDVNVNGQELLIYPNPARTTITVGLPAPTQAFVQVYNSMGDLVKTKNSINGLLTLDLTGLPAGIFTIRVQQAGSTVTREFVKY